MAKFENYANCGKRKGEKDVVRSCLEIGELFKNAFVHFRNNQ